MPRQQFQRIYQTPCGKRLFVNRRDATGKMEIQRRIVAAFWIRSYDMYFADELCELGATTKRESFLDFISEMVNCFSIEYLRCLNDADMKSILSINAAQNFPGFLGIWYCQHWHWENFPVARAGQFKEKEKKPTVVLEAIADGELWIWAYNFGRPGSLNDLNILDSSKIVEQILCGDMILDFKYEVNVKYGRLPDYVVDGIYQKWAIFIETILG